MIQFIYTKDNRYSVKAYFRHELEMEHLNAIKAVEMQVDVEKLYEDDTFKDYPLDMVFFLMFDGSVIGCCCLQTLNDNSAITNVAVLKNYHGTGLSAFMVRKAIEMAGSKNVITQCETDNIAAAKLYERLGFKYLSTLKYSNGKTGMVLKK